MAVLSSKRSVPGGLANPYKEGRSGRENYIGKEGVLKNVVCRLVVVCE
jgi:hypothetical protein